MQLSLRSQMIAGVAALSVSAIAVAPVAQPELLTVPQRVSSAVDLTAFFNPVASLAYTAYYAIGDSILSQAALLDPEELYWPDSYYTSDFSFLFAPGYAGLIPDFVNQVSFGGLSAVVSNLAGYGNAITAGLAALIDGPTTAIWNTPFALITAAGYLAAGQPELALAELQTQIIDPLVQTVTDVIGVVGYIVDNVVTNVTTLITNTVSGLVANTIDTLVNGTTYVVSSAADTLGTAFSDLLAGQIEDAWNGLVVGLLSPNGTLGQIQDLTVGIGITEFVDYEDVGEVLEVVIPSLRSNVTSAGQRLGDYNFYGEGGIRNDWYEPFPEAPAAASAAVETAPAAAPAATVSAQEVTAVEVDRPEAGEVDASESATVTAADVAASEDDGAAADTGAKSADVAAPSTGTEGSARGGSSDTAGSAKAKASRGSARGASAGS